MENTNKAVDLSIFVPFLPGLTYQPSDNDLTGFCPFDSNLVFQFYPESMYTNRLSQHTVKHLIRMMISLS